VLDGVVNDASTVEACQAACFINTSCTGVDWNPSFTVGQKCWLSGPWSGHRRSRNGITRYDIARPPDSYNCPGMYEPKVLTFANVLTNGRVSACFQLCVSFDRYVMVVCAV